MEKLQFDVFYEFGVFIFVMISEIVWLMIATYPLHFFSPGLCWFERFFCMDWLFFCGFEDIDSLTFWLPLISFKFCLAVILSNQVIQ